MAQPGIKRIPNLQRFSGVDGKLLDLDKETRISTLCRYNIKNATRRGHEMLDTIGGVGCALSHIAVWTQLANSDQNVYLILEDDILLEDDQWDKVRMLFQREASLADSTTWDIWTIGPLDCYETMGKRPADKKVVEDRWLTCSQFVGLNAYFISKQGARKLLEDVYPIQQHIDWYITYYAQTKPFKIIHNKLVNYKQRGAGSDIQMKEKCEICDIPTNFDTSHYVYKKDTLNASVLAGLSLAFIALFYLSRRR